MNIFVFGVYKSLAVKSIWSKVVSCSKVSFVDSYKELAIYLMVKKAPYNDFNSLSKEAHRLIRYPVIWSVRSLNANCPLH